jgi:hypothetical protein
MPDGQQHPRIQAEALLSGDQWIAVMRIFHGTNLDAVVRTDIMMRADHESCARSLEEITHSLDFGVAGRLARHVMIEAEDE